MSVSLKRWKRTGNYSLLVYQRVSMLGSCEVLRDVLRDRRLLVISLVSVCSVRRERVMWGCHVE